ncbi:MAG: hypothetical protein GX849_00635, partial [Clostridiaceae bacterium]|nr:hypothetical protein [Clostridiaceae bacterium]
MKDLKAASDLFQANKRRLFQKSLAISFIFLTMIAFVVIYILWGDRAIDFFSDPLNVRNLVARHPLASRLL